MSSHHIVRDKQEPALLIINLENFDPENLGQLLEWSPTVLVTDDTYEHADSLGIKIDVWISAGNGVLQPSTRVVPSLNDPLKTGMEFLINKGYPSVNIIDSRFSLNSYILFAGQINLVIYTSFLKIFPAGSGFSKWKARGEKIHLMQEIKGLQTSGLNSLTEQLLQTEQDGFYTLNFGQPFAFIAEEL